MKAKIISFILGSAITFLLMIGFWSYKNPSYTSYEISDETKRASIIQTLEKKGILYSYTIDHLKRHWITPQITDTKQLEALQKEWEASSVK